MNLGKASHRDEFRETHRKRKKKNLSQRPGEQPSKESFHLRKGGPTYISNWSAKKAHRKRERESRGKDLLRRVQFTIRRGPQRRERRGGRDL